MTRQKGDWETRIEAEFHQCPGLRLTVLQAARLWGLQPAEIEEMLSRLSNRAILVRTRGGMFMYNGACERCGG